MSLETFFTSKINGQPKNVRVLKKTAREQKLSWRKTCYSYEEKAPHYKYCLQQGSTVT